MPNEPLVAGTLGVDCYPASAQAFYEEMFSKGHAVGPDIKGLLIQDAAPDAADRGTKGWIPTASDIPIYPGYVFVWHPVVGHWVSRHPKGPSDPRPEMYIGSLADLPTFDGGDVNAPGIASGPMWEQWTPITGRVPVGAGAIPGNSPAATLAVLGTSDSEGKTGEYAHTLTGGEGAVSDHTHPIGVADPASDDAFFNVVGPPSITVPSYTAHYVTGSGHGTTLNETTANLYTLKANDGAGQTSDPHNNMMPYIGVYWIQRTAVRQFYKLG